MKHKNRPAPTCAPLTPSYDGRGDLEQVQRERIAELASDNKQLRSQLTAERKRHNRLEVALNRYLAGLEQELEAQRIAVADLKHALVPVLTVGGSN